MLPLGGRCASALRVVHVRGGIDMDGIPVLVGAEGSANVTCGGPTAFVVKGGIML